MHVLHSNSHHYKQVPLNSESDSEDDESILYAASSLNERSQNGSMFGVGVYDHGQDLELPRVRRILDKKELSMKTRRVYMKSFFALCMMVVLMVFVVVLISLFIAAVNTPGFLDSSAVNSDLTSPVPMCSPIPEPLVDNGIKPCVGGVATTTTAAAIKPTTSSAGPQHTTGTTAPAGLQHTTVSTSHHTAPATSPAGPQHTTVTTSQHTAPTTAPAGQQHTTVTTSQHAAPATAPAHTTTTTATTDTPSSNSNAPPTTITDADKSASPTLVIDDGGHSNDPDLLDDLLTPSPKASCFPVPEPLPHLQIQPCLTPDHTPSTTTEKEIVLTDASETKAESTAATTAANKPTPGGATPIPGPATPTSGDPATPTSSGPATRGPTTPTSGGPATPLSWEKAVSPALSETSPQLHDVNGDGIEEVLIVLDFSICVARVMALHSHDGSTLWSTHVNFAVFALRCILDVNGDGTLDCLISGRGGGFAALDATNGAVLWSVDPSLVVWAYNFYFPLLVGDMDNDGIADLVNTHGGRSSYPPEEHDRTPAFLVAVSGRTGQRLMDPIPMPDGHETYSSPLLFAVNQSNEYVLFGSGGETVPGSLWAIELGSLQLRMMMYHTHSVSMRKGETYEVPHSTSGSCLHTDDATQPVFDPSHFDLKQTMVNTPVGHLPCPMLAGKGALWNEYNVCLYEVVCGEKKGVILPPVKVDMTTDGILDLVVSTFDGRTMVFDGRDMGTVVWEVYYPETESYSIPAPLFYTSDHTPDLVIRTNVGAWPDYNISTMRVLDGTDGSELWSFDSSHSGMMSSISVVSKTHGHDALVFFSVGIIEDPPPEDPSKRRRRSSQARDWVEGGATDESDHVISKRHSDSKEEEEDPPDLWVSIGDDDPVPDPSDIDAVMEYCWMRKNNFIANLYMVTREMMESGMEARPLATYQPFLFDIDTPSNHTHSTTIINHEAEEEEHHTLSELDNLHIIRCHHVTLPTSLVTTPLLGDFDNDGQLDILYVVVWEGGSSKSYKTLLAASNLERLFVGAYGKGIVDFDTFLPPSEQPWTQYMGPAGDNLFTLTDT